MNLYEADVLKSLFITNSPNQRELSFITGHSLGIVNKSLKNLVSEGYLNADLTPSDFARNKVKDLSPKNAIILAAGFGMRMVPINLTTPKALIEINGEALIERQIKQLHDVGINDITVVAGFMKDSFEYLIDQYGVDIVVNEEYASKNNLHSLNLVADRIHNTYIIPCDVWCKENPFNDTELYSWYMVSDQKDESSNVRINRKKELVTISDKDLGNAMIGIAYICGDDSERLKNRLNALDDDTHADDFWEVALFEKNKMFISAREVPKKDVYEINTYEQLREIDSDSNQLKSSAIYTIAKTFSCDETEIKNITILKKGMTNRSFLFSVRGNKYIMRIPGEGTERLINRNHEAEVYRTISGLGLCDDPVYINPENGYKITKYLEGIRVCNADNIEDLKKCMKKLKTFHEMKLKVEHVFDIFGQIEFYEKLWNGAPSIYRDYLETKNKVMRLKSYIDALDKDWCLTHIDAVPDNFLFYIPEGDTEESLQLTDWEYSGMQDPHVDIAMFCIYSLYNKEECDRLIDIYFDGNCDKATRIKIYAYISMCGLLWSNWCEYKRQLGVEFGEYSLRQYRYAKEFYRYVEAYLNEKG